VLDTATEGAPGDVCTRTNKPSDALVAVIWKTCVPVDGGVIVVADDGSVRTVTGGQAGATAPVEPPEGAPDIVPDGEPEDVPIPLCVEPAEEAPDIAPDEEPEEAPVPVSMDASEGPPSGGPSRVYV